MVKPFAWRLSIPFAVAVLSLACVGCSKPATGFDYERDPVAVVLIQEGRRPSLVTVDLKAFRVVKRVKLRSFAYSMDGHAGTRTIVTAQCGGVSSDADEVSGVYRLGPRARVRYVKLPFPNPSEVAIAGDKAYVVHGFEQKEGTCFSVFDVRNPKGVRSGHLPPSAGWLKAVGGRAVVPVMRFSDDLGDSVLTRRAALVELSETRSTTMSAELLLSAVDAYSSDETSRVIVGGPYPYGSTEEPEKWALIEIDPRTGRMLRLVEAPWARDGVFAGAMTEDGLVVCDSGGRRTEDPGRSVVTLDSQTLQPVLRREIAGIPSAVAGWGNRTLVVDGEKGELLMFKSGQTKPERKLKVSSNPDGMGGVVVFP